MVNTPNATVAPPDPIDDARPVRAVERVGEGDGSPAVSLAAISKVFGTRSNATPALDRVSLTVDRGEFVCVLGASGCGKSTMLNIIAGLDRPTAGTLEVAAERPALMFQESALFPWLTAQGNVELALKLGGVPKPERKARVAGQGGAGVEAGGRAEPRGEGPRRPAARAGHPRRVRKPTPARALGRDAPVRGPRPGARAAQRPAPDGRAVRCARRHDPRPL